MSQKQSVVDGMRMIALKLEFGVFHNQVFERYLSICILEHAEELCVMSVIV